MVTTHLVLFNFFTGASPVGAAATAVVTIDGGASATEADIVAGSKDVVIELTNDTWVASGATFNAQRQAIIDGMDAALSPALGWNAEVRDKEVVGAVVRTSDTVATITLTASALYDISSNETITMTVPAAALVTSGSDVTATPTFAVTFVPIVVVPDDGGNGAGEARGGAAGGPDRPEPRRRRQEALRKPGEDRSNYGPVHPDDPEFKDETSFVLEKTVVDEGGALDDRIRELETLKANLKSDESRVEALGTGLDDVEAELAHLTQVRQNAILLLLMLD